MDILCLGLFFLLLPCLSRSEEIKRLTLNPISSMVRADLYCIKTVPNPDAVLVLSPGCNGDGKGLVSDPTWQTFAKTHNLGLVGLSFASEIDDLHSNNGYYNAVNGSGKLLLDGNQVVQ